METDDASLASWRLNCWAMIPETPPAAAQSETTDRSGVVGVPIKSPCSTLTAVRAQRRECRDFNKRPKQTEQSGRVLSNGLTAGSFSFFTSGLFHGKPPSRQTVAATRHCCWWSLQATPTPHRAEPQHKLARVVRREEWCN